MSAGAHDRDLQGGRARRREFVRRFALAEIDGSHALGHTRMATESRVTTEHSHPFSTGLDLCLVHNGSLSNHNRLRRDAAARGDPLPDRQRQRGRGRLPDLADARGRDARAGARGLPGRPRRLLHVRGRNGRRLRGAARSDRLQAGGDGRDRRVGGDGLRVPGDRGAARAPRTPSPGSPSRAGCTAGARRWWPDGGTGGHRGRRADRSTSPPTACASSTQRLHAGRARSAACASCIPAGRHSIAVGLDAPYEVEIEGHVGYYCAGMNKLATRPRARQLRRRRGREHDVGHGDRRGQREPVGGRHRPRRPARDPRRRLGALRDLAQGRRHRRARLGRPHERVHGPEGVPGGVRRRRRGARRLAVRGAAVRARRGGRPRRRLRREGDARRARGPAARAAGAGRDRRRRRRSSAATARPAGSTTSRSTTSGAY